MNEPADYSPAEQEAIRRVMRERRDVRCFQPTPIPAPVLRRIAGALIAAVVLQTLNIIRIVSLYLIGLKWPKIFETAHLAIWQTLMFGAAVFLFLIWTSIVAPRNAPAGT